MIFSATSVSLVLRSRVDFVHGLLAALFDPHLHAFRGSENNAHRTVVERNIDYVLICPNLSESTIYRARAPEGFYVQLTKGEVPDWLERVKLPDNSPYMMWRVKR